MAATSVLSKIEDLIGDVTETVAVGEWASDIAREVINPLPQDMLWSVSTTIDDPGSGATLTTAKFLYAHKSGYPANEIKPEMRARATDNDSIYLATVQSPAFYRQAGKIYVLPSGGSVEAVSYPTIKYNDADISGVPDDVKHLVILGTAVKGRLNQLNTLREGVKDISSPTYTVATITLENTPSITDLSISATAPTVPPNPDFNAGAITVSTSAPTYTKPTLVLGSSPNLTPLDLTTNLTLPTKPTNPTYSYIDVGDIPTIGDTNVTLGSAPTYSGPTSTVSVAKAETYIRTDEDVELANIELQKVSIELNKFQGDVANALNEFNEANVVYQAELQKAIQNARLDQERILAEIQIEQDNKRQDRLQSLQTQIQNYEADLSQYGTEMQEYQAKINNTIQLYQSNEVQAKLEVWQKERSDDLNKYQLDVQNELNEFNREQTIYQNELQEKIQEASNQQTKDSAEYGAILQRFSNDIQLYQAKVNDEVTQYTINEIQKEIALWSEKQGQLLAKYGSDMQNNNSKFQSEFGVYGRKLDLEFQKHSTMMSELGLLEKQYQQGLQTFIASYTLPKGDSDGQ